MFCFPSNDKDLRKLWLGNFDDCNNSWDFSGSPYPTRVGAKFGNALAFDGSSSLYTSLNLNSDNLAIYFFFCPFSLANSTLLSISGATSLSAKIANSKLVVSHNGTNYTSGTLALSSSYFLAILFKYSTYQTHTYRDFEVYLNGTQVGSSGYFSSFNGACNITLGNGFTGAVSEFCIQQNSSSYSVPSSTFSKNSNTKSLLHFAY